MKDTTTTADSVRSSLPKYETPKITVMDEQEVLKAFQITSASISWWSM